MKKKVLICANRMECGGTEVVVLSYINQLIQCGADVTLMLLEKKGVWLNKVPETIKVIEYPGPRTIKEALLSNRSFLDFCRILFGCFLVKIGKKNSLDLLISCVNFNDTQYDLALDINGYGYLLTPYIAQKVQASQKATWIHDETVGWVTYINQFLPAYNKIICVSQSVEAEMAKFVPEYRDKLQVIYNPINVEEILEKSKEKCDSIFQKNKFNILTVARIHPQKGITKIFEIVEELSKKNIEFLWHIIGDGELLEEYTNCVKEKGLDDRIVFWGRKNNPYPYMRNCDLYVQPSFHEGFGLTVLEARILNKIIVATDLPCFREQIIDGVNGFLVPMDTKEFSDRLEYIFSDYEGVREKLNFSVNRVNYESEFEKIKSLMNIEVEENE